MRGPDEQRRLRARLDALGPAPRAELLEVLMLPDFERADAIGSYWGNPETLTFGELLIDREEDQTPRAAETVTAPLAAPLDLGQRADAQSARSWVRNML